MIKTDGQEIMRFVSINKTAEHTMTVLQEKDLEKNSNRIPRNKSSSTTGIRTILVAMCCVQKKRVGGICLGTGSWLKTPRAIAILEIRARPIPKQKRREEPFKSWLLICSIRFLCNSHPYTSNAMTPAWVV